MSIIDIAKSYLGTTEGSSKHREIIDEYNKIKHAGGYAMTYSDPWCAAFASLCAYKAGVRAPIEVNTEAIRGQVKVTSSSRPGYFAFFDWNGDGLSDHIGIVESVSGNTVSVISGNYSNQVKRSQHNVNEILCFGVIGDGEDILEPVAQNNTTDDIEYKTVLNGSVDPFVFVCQGLLVIRGFDVGRYGIDGEFGNDTEAALIAFQKKAGLTADGVCGSNTWEKLKAGR